MIAMTQRMRLAMMRMGYSIPKEWKYAEPLRPVSMTSATKVAARKPKVV